MQGLRLKGGARVCANKDLHFHLSLYHPAEPATIVATPLSGCAGIPGITHDTSSSAGNKKTKRLSDFRRFVFSFFPFLLLSYVIIMVVRQPFI